MNKKEQEMTTLCDITGQESGIVVYGDEVIVCNWAQESPYGGLPRLGPAGGIIEWPGELKVTAQWFVEDIRDVLDYEGMDVLYDLNGDIPALYDNALPTPGTVYEINNNVIVIAPEGWC